MRAVVMRPDSLSVEERPIPRPGPGQVLVRMLACGICGSDVHLYRHAQSFYDMGVAAGVSKEILDRGIILGHEFVGEIVEFGPATQQTLDIGARVLSIPFLSNDQDRVPHGATPFVDGAYAEYFLLSEEFLLSIPDSLETEAAALTEPLAIGLHAVNASAVVAEQAVVLGCGPIGLAVIAALKSQGCRRIIASDLSSSRCDLAARTGASVTVDANQDSPFDHVDASTSVAVYDCTGVSGMIESCIQAVPRCSEIVVAGISHGQEAITPSIAISKEITIRFVSFYEQDEFATALQMLTSGEIGWRSWISGQVSLENVAHAFESLNSDGQHVKMLVTASLNNA